MSSILSSIFFCFQGMGFLFILIFHPRWWVYLFSIFLSYTMKVIIYNKSNKNRIISNFATLQAGCCILNSTFKIKSFLRRVGFDEAIVVIEGSFSQEALLLLLQDGNLCIEITTNNSKKYIYQSCIVQEHSSFQNLTTITIKASLAYNNNITKYVCKVCSAKFCDKFCGLNIDSYTYRSQIKKVISPSVFENNAATFNFNIANASFNFTSLIFTSGANINQQFAVKTIDSNIVSLLQVPKFLMQEGDLFTLTQSCNKTYQSCKTFNNTPNYRGF